MCGRDGILEDEVPTGEDTSPGCAAGKGACSKPKLAG